MKWDYCISTYLEHHCLVRGLRPSTIAAYRDVLQQFKEYMISPLDKTAPEKVKTRDVLEYVEYLRTVRKNGDSAVVRAVTIIQGFYRALVALGELDHRDNPMKRFPKLKGPKRRFRDLLNLKEIKRLIKTPRTDTVLGIRDRAILILLYGTGIRASECAGLREMDVKLDEKIIHVAGKGGDQRTVPLNGDVLNALRQYRMVRGPVKKETLFFRSRRQGKGLSRYGIYERVKTYVRRARIKKKISPHSLRHAFATHLIRNDVNLVVLRDLLGHRQLSSTQIYLHMTAEDLREALEQHPIRHIVKMVKNILPNVKLPFQYKPGERACFNSA